MDLSREATAVPGASGGSRLAIAWERLNGPDRAGGVDLARGLAVFGMFAAHLTALPELVWTDPATWGGLADGRSSILFATLAGVSIGLMTGGAHPVIGDRLRTARLRLAVRALLIWTLGVLLILTGVPVYVILPAYAILFLLALPFLPLRTPVLAATAVAVGLTMPFVFAAVERAPLWASPLAGDLSLATGWHYPFIVWLAFVLAGMAAARADVRRAATQAGMLGIGAALAVIGYGTAALTGAGSFAPWSAEPHSSGVWEVIGSGGFALAVIGACLLVCRSPLTWVLLPVRAVGAMPLTAYTAQLVAWAIVAALTLDRVGDLTGFRAMQPLAPFLLLTVIGCTAWALLVGRGPLEWALDAASRLASRPWGTRRLGA